MHKWRADHSLREKVLSITWDRTRVVQLGNKHFYTLSCLTGPGLYVYLCIYIHICITVCGSVLVYRYMYMSLCACTHKLECV